MLDGRTKGAQKENMKYQIWSFFTVIILCCLLFLTNCLSSNKQSHNSIIKDNNYSVSLNKEFLVSENEYSISTEFNIYISSLSYINGVYLVISRNEIDLEAIIGNEIEESIFSVGNMLITDYTAQRSLCFNSDLVNNFLPANDDKNKLDYIVSVKSISETDNTMSFDKLHCYFFNDLNDNKIIDAYEIKKIVIHINPINTLTGDKAYVSTVGYKAMPLSNTNSYTVYHITSYNSYLNFKENVTPNVSNYDLIMKNADSFTDINYYIVHSPITNILFINQPYKYQNSNLLIFDVTKDKGISDITYISARNYQVKKSKDIYTICINDFGNIIYPRIIKY